MREIKFRGKRLNKGDWAYGYYLPWHSVKDMTTGEDIYAQIFEEPDEKHPRGWAKVIASTLGQYTGLKDKNGKEIYEGDIVSLNKDLLGSYVVKYDIKNARFSMYRDNYEQAGFNLETMKNYEIIGNIYDDPALIKE